MIQDTVVTFKKPAEFHDEPTELLRAGAKHLLIQAVGENWSISGQNTSISIMPRDAEQSSETVICQSARY